MKPSKSDLDHASRKTCELTGLKYADLGDGMFSGYASTWDVVDRQGERVLKGAFSRHLADFKRYGYLSWNHDHAKPVGTIRDAREDGRGLYVEGAFHSDADSQRVRTVVKERLARGQGVGMSIGYKVIGSRKARDATELTELAIFETSLLSLPAANPEAGAIAVKSAGGPMSDWQQLQLKARAFREAQSSLGLGNDWAQVIVNNPKFKEGKLGWSEYGQSDPVIIKAPHLDLFKAAGDPIASGQFTTVETVPGLAQHAFKPSNVLSFITRVTTSSANVVYSIVTSPLTNNAGFIAEGTLKPEVQPRWSSATTHLETVATWCSVTRQALDDMPALEQTMNTDLRLALLDALAADVIAGSGTSPHLLGLLNTPNIQTTTFSAGASILSQLRAAIAAIEANGYGTASGIVMHPTDILSLSNMTVPATGVYALPVTLPPIAADSHLPVGTGIVADWTYVRLFQKDGIVFKTDFQFDDLVKNKLTIVAHYRAALTVSRPQSVVKVLFA